MKRIRKAIEAWHDATLYPRLRLPTALQFPVNDICNSRCQMCHIWKQKKDTELTVGNVRKVLADPLFRQVSSLGVNGGEPTLRPDLHELVAAAIETLPSLESISLITNGLRSDRVIAAVERIGASCRDHRVHLDVMVSIDGVGDVHDRVRGVPGNFKSSLEVVDYILASPLVSSRRIGCTIIAENVFGVEDVLEFARGRSIYARFRLGVPHPRLYTRDLNAPFSLLPEARFHVAAFLDTLYLDYERDAGRKAFYRSLRNQLVYGHSRTAGCAWKNRGVTLGPRGELAYCAVASPTLGNALNESANVVYWDNVPILDGILRDKCSGCRHDYDGIGDRRVLMRQWSARIVSKLPGSASRSLRTARRWCREGLEWIDALKPPLNLDGASGARVERAILLCGWYGTETLGDRAILAGLCRLFADVMPGVPIDLASLEPYVSEETCRLMPEMKVRKVISLATAMSEVAGLRYALIAIAGGPLMTPVREVIELKQLFKLASRVGAKTAIMGCGLGPLARSGPRLRAVASLVSEADMCILRDRQSVEIAKKLGRIRPTLAAVDPAFFWTSLQHATCVVPTRNKRVVALALREWSIAEYAADMSVEQAIALKARFESELVTLVQTLRAKDDVLVTFVYMHTLTVGGDDRAFGRRLFGGDGGGGEQIEWRRRTPRDELDILRTADGVIAMRFHSCVFCLAMGKPFIAIDYTRGGKIAGLLDDFQRSDARIDLESFSGRAAAEKLLEQLVLKRMPLPVDVTSGERTFRACLSELKQHIDALSPLPNSVSSA